MPGITLEMRNEHAIIKVMITPPDRQAKSEPHPTASSYAAGDAAIPSDAAHQRIQDLLAALSQANAAYQTLQQEKIGRASCRERV